MFSLLFLRSSSRWTKTRPLRTNSSLSACSRSPPPWSTKPLTFDPVRTEGAGLNMSFSTQGLEGRRAAEAFWMFNRWRTKAAAAADGPWEPSEPRFCSSWRNMEEAAGAPWGSSCLWTPLTLFWPTKIQNVKFKEPTGSDGTVSSGRSDRSGDQRSILNGPRRYEALTWEQLGARRIPTRSLLNTTPPRSRPLSRSESHPAQQSCGPISWRSSPASWFWPGFGFSFLHLKPLKRIQLSLKKTLSFSEQVSASKMIKSFTSLTKTTRIIQIKFINASYLFNVSWGQEIMWINETLVCSDCPEVNQTLDNSVEF